MQAQNTFNEGMVLDNHPLMTPNTVLTDALNATLVTMNGNEMVLQNDMGNAKVENAKLPPGYIPVGMKEYGGIIYIACYNPLTNKGQIGCFPSPQRQKTATQISEVTPTFKFPDVTYIKEENGEEWYKINSLLTKCEIFPKGTIIRSGDKFSVGLPISSMFGTDNIDYTGENYISNYNNVEKGLVKTPMNRMYTFGIATLDNNGQLRDITNQLKRYKGGQQIQFSNIDSDLYKFNCGYWQNEMSTEDKDGLVSSELMDQTSIQSKLNTYNSKLFGRLFLYAKYNTVQSIEVSVVGYKNLDDNNTINNPIYTGYTDNDYSDIKLPLIQNQKYLQIDSKILLLIYVNYKYNCPDGSKALNSKNLVEPLEGYEYYFDKNDQSIIRGIQFIIDNNSIYNLPFAIPNDHNKNYNLGYGYPLYDKITNIYSFSQVYALPLNTTDKVSWEAYPITYFYDNGLKSGEIPDENVSGELNPDNINSGKMELNAWRYYINNDRVLLTWGFESYPRENDTISEVSFSFYDVAYNTLKWKFFTKERISYNGEFNENFDISNFISNSSNYNNSVIPNKLFYVDISWKYNSQERHAYRWMLITGLYNPSYYGNSEYPLIKDYNSFLDCYYVLNNKNYIYSTEVQPKYLQVCTETNTNVVNEQNIPITAELISDKKDYKGWEEAKKEDDIKDKLRIPSNYFNYNISYSFSNAQISNIPELVQTGNRIFTETDDEVHQLTQGYNFNNTSVKANIDYLTNQNYPININVESSMLDTQSTQADIKSETMTITESTTSVNSNIITSTFTGTAETTYKAKLGKSKIIKLSPLSDHKNFQDLLIPDDQYHISNSYSIYGRSETTGYDNSAVIIRQIKTYDFTKASESVGEPIELVYAQGKHDDTDISTTCNWLQYKWFGNTKNTGGAKLPDTIINTLDYSNRNVIAICGLDYKYDSEWQGSNGQYLKKLKSKDGYYIPETKPSGVYPYSPVLLIKDITQGYTLINLFGTIGSYNNSSDDVPPNKQMYKDYINKNLKIIFDALSNYFVSLDNESIIFIPNRDIKNDGSIAVTITVNLSLKFNKNSIDANFNKYIWDTFKDDKLSALIKTNIFVKDNSTMEIPIIEIPDIKQDILDLQNNASVCIINGEQIYTQTSSGQSLIPGKIYRLDSGKIYQDSNFVMKDDQIYANGISNNLPKSIYGYCSRVNDNETATFTFEGIPYINLTNTPENSQKLV